MKKIIFILITAFTAGSIHAQLPNTQWKARINTGATINVVFDFKKDTCSIYNIADSSIIETMSYNVNDTAFTVHKIDGQSDCEASTIGKYRFEIKDGALYIRLLTDDCDDRSSVLDNTKWVPWKIPQEVKVDESVLKQRVGVYQLDEAHPIYITLEDGRLYVTGPNNQLPKSPLLAESDTKFFLKIAAVEFDFVKDANGNVIKLISHEEKDYELKKVK